MQSSNSGFMEEPPPNKRLHTSRHRSSRVKVACSLCSAAKVRCDQNRPCSRCKSRGTSELCVDRPATPQSNRTTIPKQLKEIKACNPCYLAKVACSDMRPCPRCVRLHQAGSCIILSRRNSSQQQQRIAQPQTPSRQQASSSSAPLSIFPRPIIVPATLRNLLMNAVFIRYTAVEIARFVRNPSRM